MASGPFTAGKPWQCQHWVAKRRRTPGIPGSARAERRMPGIPGSANTGWQKGRECRESLAVPELSGKCRKSLAVPTLGGEAAARAGNPWQCQPLAASNRVPPTSAAVREAWPRFFVLLAEACYWRRRLMGCFCSTGGRISYGRFQNGLIRSSSSCAEAVELARWYEGMKLMSSR